MCSLKILLINNEPNSEDLGLIPDAEEYGLPSGCLQIQNLKKKLAAYGEVIVLHYKALEQLNFIPDCIFLSGRFAPWDAKTLDTEFCKEMDLIRNPPCPVFGICAGIQLIAAAFGSPCVDMSHPEGEHGYQSLDIICDSVLTKGMDQCTVFPLSCRKGMFPTQRVPAACIIPRLPHSDDGTYNTSDFWHTVSPGIILRCIPGWQKAFRKFVCKNCYYSAQ